MGNYSILSGMKTRLSAIGFFILMCFGMYIYFKAGKTVFSSKEHLAADKKQMPNDWLFRQRAYPFGKIDSKAYLKASKEKIEKASQQTGLQDRGDDSWKFCGPMNISGRVTDIEMTLEEPYILYVAAASCPLQDDALKKYLFFPL